METEFTKWKTGPDKLAQKVVGLVFGILLSVVGINAICKAVDFLAATTPLPK